MVSNGTANGAGPTGDFITAVTGAPMSPTQGSGPQEGGSLPGAGIPPTAGQPVSAPPPVSTPVQAPPVVAAADIEVSRASFIRRHGRPPRGREIQALTAVRMLQGNLGRQPTRIEVMQQLAGRDLTKPARPQFEEAMGDPGAAGV
jgi:hypothetical protein